MAEELIRQAQARSAQSRAALLPDLGASVGQQNQTRNLAALGIRLQASIPWLRGYIHETDLGRVKLGARVKVTTDSYPGKVYWGRLSFIASDAEFTPKQIQTTAERVKLVYRIKLTFRIPGTN